MRGVVAILYGWAVQKIVDFTSVVNDEPLQIAIMRSYASVESLRMSLFAPRFRQLIETLLDLRNEKCISCQEYLPQQVHTSAALMCDNTHELFRSLYSRILSYFKMQISDSHDANNPQSFTSSNQPRILRF